MYLVKNLAIIKLTLLTLIRADILIMSNSSACSASNKAIIWQLLYICECTHVKPNWQILCIVLMCAFLTFPLWILFRNYIHMQVSCNPTYTDGVIEERGWWVQFPLISSETFGWMNSREVWRWFGSINSSASENNLLCEWFD
jgi:hypothetical protein